MTYAPHPAEARALLEFAPLMQALRTALPDDQDYVLDVENTGGHIYCLFIRHQNDNRSPHDRCVVLSENGWNEPDPTAWAQAQAGLYRDWSDPDDVDRIYEGPAIRFNAEHVDRVVDWLLPLIRGWLEVPHD